jgi:biopolymer transport protein ExbB/TolQ
LIYPAEISGIFIAVNILTASTPLVLAIWTMVLFVLAGSFLLNRDRSNKARLTHAALLALATLFCLETLWVTYSLLPPAEYALATAVDQQSQSLNDWVSTAGVNMGDLYIAWILVIAALGSAHFIKQSGSTTNTSSAHSFYSHFGTTAIMAVVITSIFYLFVVIPAYFESNIILFDKILFRGPIPYITVGLFFWVLFNVALLAHGILNQRTQDAEVEQALYNDGLDSLNQTSLLKRRIDEITSISNKQQPTLSEYNQVVEQQAQLEREDTDVSILYLHTAMWAIPVLGFLGTVWGIAEAVANLIPLLQGLSAQALGGPQLADSLAGLGVAFDTTLVALALSLPAMAIISLLEKSAYEDMLIRNRIVLHHVRQLT